MVRFANPLSSERKEICFVSSSTRFTPFRDCHRNYSDFRSLTNDIEHLLIFLREGVTNHDCCLLCHILSYFLGAIDKGSGKINWESFHCCMLESERLDRFSLLFCKYFTKFD